MSKRACRPASCHLFNDKCGELYYSPRYFVLTPRLWERSAITCNLFCIWLSFVTVHLFVSSAAFPVSFFIRRKKKRYLILMISFDRGTRVKRPRPRSNSQCCLRYVLSYLWSEDLSNNYTSWKKLRSAARLLTLFPAGGPASVIKKIDPNRM